MGEIRVFRKYWSPKYRWPDNLLSEAFPPYREYSDEDRETALETLSEMSEKNRIFLIKVYKEHNSLSKVVNMSPAVGQRRNGDAISEFTLLLIRRGFVEDYKDLPIDVLFGYLYRVSENIKKQYGLYVFKSNGILTIGDIENESEKSLRKFHTRYIAKIKASLALAGLKLRDNKPPYPENTLMLFQNLTEDELGAILGEFSERERDIFLEHQRDHKTFKEIGMEHDFSRQRAHQIYCDVMSLLATENARKEIL